MTATTTMHNSILIGGRFKDVSDSDPTYEVVSPGTGEVVAVVPEPTVADAEAAALAARRAFDNGPWPRMDLAERIEILGRFCDEFEARLPEFNDAWVTESGPTLAHASGLNGVVVSLWRGLLEDARDLELVEHRDVADGKVDVVREPIGPAAIIAAWNGPGLYVGMKAVPALLAGCTVVFKMAQESKLTAHLVAEAARAAGFPEGVFSVLAGSTEVSQHLVSQPGIEKVSLTGSIPAGRAVMAAGADRIANITLELGGKSPAVIADDIAVEDVLPSLVPGFISYQGQICAALTRVIVPRERQQEFVDGIVDALSAMKVGSPTDPDSDLGPLASRRQLDRVIEYVDSAKEEGARLVLGGNRKTDAGEGFYFEPTVFADVTPEMKVAREEIFGPVLSIIPVDSVEEALEVANGTEYGLAASVYAKDSDLARELASRIQAGAVSVNTAGVSLFAPFGGYKQSGNGREFGLEGVSEFLQYKSIKLS